MRCSAKYLAYSRFDVLMYMSGFVQLAQLIVSIRRNSNSSYLGTRGTSKGFNRQMHFYLSTPADYLYSHLFYSWPQVILF